MVPRQGNAMAETPSIANSALRVSLAISHLIANAPWWNNYNHLISNKSEWNNCFIKNTHKISLNLPDFNNFVRTNRKRQGTSAIHMSHVYQNCQRANGLAWTAWMKNQNIVAMNISFLKTHRDSRILHSRTAKKTWQIMWRKRIFKWQPSKLLWIWIFGAVTKVRTTEKNYYLGRLLWSCLKPQAGFADRGKEAILPPRLL